ncbi:VanW family protein [Dysgonomonas capnocytophagoides]|uniref:VanW family protein n=1 Tax=Dysgonomonas capnocytophagoides TaxID=45254 RepID=UPI0029263B9B|nr:hypothetical protein DCPSUM001_13550 [Dysgonomonas capnocytophagoides]
MKIKKLIPSSLRLRYKLIKRYTEDRNKGVIFASVRVTESPFEHSISETQEIRKSEYYQNKIDNIRLGTNLIERIIITSGETFSFWRAIGNPSPEKGFKMGRNLIDGKLKADYGGGLCQLSGIIYLCALKAGLSINERYNHTVDIYTEEERFTPLGADATVVYGYKDLRVVNPYPFDIRFEFEIQDGYMSCNLLSTKPITERTVEFRRKKYLNRVVVETFSDNKYLNTSEYLI